MGERFSRFREAWGDTWEDPLKGLPFKERRRLNKLAQSGRRIADPQEAERVREAVSWMDRVSRRWLTLSIGYLFLLPVMAVFWWTIGGPLWLGLVAVAVSIVPVWQILFLRRRLSRTIQSNGWGEPGRA
jgi:hypothetical protein